jgi:nicotinate-nucleotide pyrophosphorylase (carboxylating)
MNEMAVFGLIPQIKHWLEEDDLLRNFHYSRSLPVTHVFPSLKIKSSLVLAGTDYLKATFVALGSDYKDFDFLSDLEGRTFASGETIEFPKSISFSRAVTGERLALNLVQHASSIATLTRKFVALAEPVGIKILDTRKTTPGMRALEKYAVRVGGGFNHRIGQTDTWMIKDNHKSSLGGIAGAWKFFQSQGAFYNNTVAEIHSIDELRTARELGIRHVMLDNFKIADIEEAIKLKLPGMIFELSGGITLDTLPKFLIKGVDAISVGALTHSAPRVDISLKFGTK